MIWIQPCHFISCNSDAAPLSLGLIVASLLLIHFAYLSGISALFTWSALAPHVSIISKLTYFVFCHVYLVFCHHTCYYSDIFSAFSHYHDSGLPQSSIFRDVINIKLLSKVFIRFWSSFKSFGFYKFCISIVYIMYLYHWY